MRSEQESDLESLELKLLNLQRRALHITYRTQCQVSFLSFVRHMRPEWNIPWFHIDIIGKLQRCAEGSIKRIIISMPPGHAKSTLSRLFLAWFIGRNPELSNIATSYTDELAGECNTFVQDVMLSDSYRQVFPDTVIAKRNNSRLKTTRGGSLYTTGIMGGITGKRASGCILIDDPVKNYEDASSEATKRKLEYEWQYSIRSRTQQGTVVIVIMTRWLTDDFAGRRLEDAANNARADQWVEVNYPLIKTDPLATHDPRTVGEALWPAGGYDQAWANTTKETIEPHAWDGPYQQSPSVIGGGILKTFKFKFWFYPGCEPQPITMPNNDGDMVTIEQVPLPGYFRRVLQSWDMTFKKTSSGSFVAGGVWGHGAPETPAAAFLLNQYRERTDFDGACRMVRQAKSDYPMGHEIWFEDKANGPGIKDHLSGTIAGISLIAPKGDKTERAHTAAVYLNAGNVYIPHPSVFDWVKGFIAECGAFPKGKNDDQVDQFSQACQLLFNQARWKVR